MSDTNAKIRGKGLEHTGVTEKHAETMFERVGTHYVGVVDLVVVDRHGPNVDGKRSVDLAIDSIELAPNDDVAEHIRRLLRAAHYERGLAVNGGDQLPIPGSDEPTVEQVRAAGRQHEQDPEADETALAEQEADAASEGEQDDDSVPDPDGDQPWEYDGPEGITDPGESNGLADLDHDDDPEPAAASTVGSPFDIPDPEPTPAA